MIEGTADRGGAESLTCSEPGPVSGLQRFPYSHNDRARFTSQQVTMTSQFKKGQHSTILVRHLPLSVFSLYPFCPNTPRVERIVGDVLRVDQAPLLSSFPLV